MKHALVLFLRVLRFLGVVATLPGQAIKQGCDFALDRLDPLLPKVAP